MPWMRLKLKRITHAILTDSGEIHEVTDEWSADSHLNINDPFGEEWTGWTEFEIEDEEVNEPMNQRIDDPSEAEAKLSGKGGGQQFRPFR